MDISGKKRNEEYKKVGVREMRTPSFFHRRAENGTRTHDLLITNELLYQLSYFGKMLLFDESGANIECFFETKNKKRRILLLRFSRLC